MKEDKTTVKTSTGKENEPVIENTTKKKTKEEKPPTKVVVRRLPPTMTEEQFKMQVSPLPDYDYFYFVPADMSLMPNAFSRAYINFKDQNDLFIFTQKFDGYVFVDSKGGEFPAVVEFAPFQRIPKNRPNRKKDSKVGTIETDPIFIAFKERMEAETLENKTAINTSKQHFFETSLASDKKEEVSNTPLLDYIRNKRAERQRIREEKREEKKKKDLERRRAKEEQRRVKKDDDTSVVKVLNSSQSLNKERPKEKEVKPTFVKKKPDEGKTTTKEKVSLETRSKEGKRTGKSYLEERQRLAERREEQRKKQSQGQSNSTTTNSKLPPTVDESKSLDVDEERSLEDKSDLATETKGKETDHKKSERVFKREDRRSSYKYEKYETKRERDDDSRRPKKGSERSYQSGRREDERSEDGGRKRYSESRRAHDATQRDRYKDKEKNRGYSQKKGESVTEADKKVKSDKESSEKSSDLNKNPEEVSEENKSKHDDTQKSEAKNDVTENNGEEKSEKLDEGANGKSLDSSKLTRRKSLDYDKAKSSLSYSKTYTKEKYSEKKRRNSMGSSKSPGEHMEQSFFENGREAVVKNNTTVGKTSEKENLSTKVNPETPESELKSAREREIRKEFEDDQREIPKRRNSTGGQEAEKMSPRRNSLGSEDKSNDCAFKEHKGDREIISEEEKFKDENQGRKNSQDPRTERRIRNKDRPSLEIYRPGMGRFSKQRLEREREKEKGLGSSTEIDSPSPSPSPTPQLRHKSTTPH